MGDLKKRETPHRRKKRGGLTIRWLLTTILVIFIILASIDYAAVEIMHRYYYGVVTERLLTMGQSTALADYFSSYIGTSDDTFTVRAREYTDNLPSTTTSVAEVWVINGAGETVATSTGFMPAESTIPDYEDALVSDTGRAFFTGRTESTGERIMAMTVLLPKTDGKSNGGVRYMISLELIDAQLTRLTFIASLICAFALLLVVLSGLFFVRSIVRPVNRLNFAAGRIAAGNYGERVEIRKNYNDEITELSETINFMTEEIERTDKMRTDFISTVSHELRTPLTAIRGWSETLLSMDEKSGETVNTGLRIIQGETDRLYSLVEDLLDFSRMESGRLSLRLAKTDLNAELEETVLALSSNASRDGKHIEYSIPETPALAEADPDRIRQVFVNILDNAIKYSNAGGIIVVSSHTSGKEFTAVFRDYGCGISAEDLPHVKEKFYKANITVRGSGIGLAVCDEIIRLHGGTLDISSKPGEGTAVTVKLKLV